MITVSTTVSPAELGQFLDAVASAPVALRDVPRINSILARLVGLANSTGNIGVVPKDEPSKPAQTQLDALREAGADVGSVLAAQKADSPVDPGWDVATLKHVG